MSGIEPQLFRTVLGHLPTGVTAITAHTDDGPEGMAANSVSSVSLEPPLILFCPAKSSTTWPRIRGAGRFCVNVMADHHAEAARRFSQRDTDRFAGIEWHDRPTGPAIADALAWIECEIEAEHDAGDHTVAIARVLAVEARQGGSALVFFRGRFGTFAEAAGVDPDPRP